MPNVEVTIIPPLDGEFVRGWPGIPPSLENPPAGVQGDVVVQTLKEGVSAQWVRIELRKVEVLPGGGENNTFYDGLGPHPLTLWGADDKYNNLYSQRLPFFIGIPDSTPPTVTLQNRAGIRYELVATVCMKGKGVLSREKNATVRKMVPVIIDKHELHSPWPIYCQPEKQEVTGADGNLTIERRQTCHGPGDHISVAATFKLNSTYRVVVLQGLELTLKELINFRTTYDKPPLTLLADVAETKLPVNTTVYAGRMTYQTELACQVPRTHSTPTISTAHHVYVTYHLSIKALLNTGMHIVKDFPVIITNWERCDAQPPLFFLAIS
ncbi:hypothetical protein P691DRAFT_843738 [Macrolepiota fuliginosa MF-IS2]|uniref:Arrestin C-terminal-like domain-containing protein n=1 Tax=Macrolepiota fuliginosa MF-IS2 TaxID=1400762 RepID=A0A9P5X1R1_9AGAR|nr:hypothetical protein P691DRAFT_843738 [Macrolepiota fuliginosa MF-IS2]